MISVLKKIARTKHVVLFTLFAMNLVYQPTPEVQIDQGILSGKVSVDGSFLEYVGIPYATTNKDSRFQAPLPPQKWEGVYKAIDEMYQCPQQSPFGVIGTEDCLKINVYVPITNIKGPLPVMVYIHGGAFVTGSGGKLIVGPEFIVRYDVILVSFNYRLGALGFLCLGIKEAPGNAGLKDQIAALRWIQRNIAAFGGDPDNVTIFGTSAGGASVSLLVASEATHGLFKKAIMHSGSSLTPFAINNDPISVASSIAKKLGYDTKDPKELYDIFSKPSYKDLISKTSHIPLAQILKPDILQVPCVDKNIPGVEPVLNDLPYNLLTTKPKNIPLMYSSTNREGMFFTEEETEETLEYTNKHNLFGNDLVFKSKKEEKDVAQQVREYYFGKEDVSKKTLLNLADLYGHLFFEMPAIFEAELMASRIDSLVYNYYFTYAGGRNLVKDGRVFRNEIGAYHGDDLLYTFKGIVWPYKINEKDQQVIDWLTTMLTNFAKYGNPTPNDQPIKWVPHNKDELNFLKIDEELKMVSVPNLSTYQFWKEIYGKYRRTS